jgi:membrane protein DedA with SNARE-associated domain
LDDATPGEEPAAPEGEEPEKEWWDDPGMPWKHKPTGTDMACMAWIGVIGILGLVMLPLRGWLLGRSVPVLLSITGSRSAAAALGSLVRVGEYAAWWLPMVAGVLMSIKLDWVYWWAGKLWGRGMIEVWAGQSERASRNYARAERWANKWGSFGMFVAYVPIPLPVMPVVFILAGASGMPVRRFVALDFVVCAIWQTAYFMLGYAIGEPAVAVLKEYAKWANYIAIGLVVFVLGSYFFNLWRKQKA